MEKAEDWARVHLIIEGRVQGVFFRAATEKVAHRLELKGWVKNLPDGAVEVVAEGERKKVEELVAWCRHGPPGAHVRHVRLQWQQYQDEVRDFRIKR
jgi:acylphosphatase